MHIHVYKIAELAEVDLDESDEVKAREQALKLARAGALEFQEPDCKYIALGPLEAWGHEKEQT